MSEKVEIIDVSADWCPPCKALKGELELVKNENPDWNIIEYNAEDGGKGQEFADSNGVEAYPTLFFKVKVGDKELSQTVVGFMKSDEVIKQVNDILDALKTKD